MCFCKWEVRDIKTPNTFMLGVGWFKKKNVVVGLQYLYLADPGSQFSWHLEKYWFLRTDHFDRNAGLTYESLACLEYGQGLKPFFPKSLFRLGKEGLHLKSLGVFDTSPKRSMADCQYSSATSYSTSLFLVWTNKSGKRNRFAGTSPLLNLEMILSCITSVDGLPMIASTSQMPLSTVNNRRNKLLSPRLPNRWHAPQLTYF